MKTTGQFVVLIAGCILLQAACNGQDMHLPKPGGEYYSGITYRSFTDSTRRELFDSSGNSLREISLKIWYPAEEKTVTQPYLEDTDVAIQMFGFSTDVKALLSNSSLNVSIAGKQDSYPVLIYSHGWGEHFSLNTILMEELASHGYIVFSIGHPYESMFSYYPDGHLVLLDSDSDRFQRMIMEQQNPAAFEIFNEMYVAATDSARAQIFLKSESLMPTLLNDSPMYWAEDTEFLIEKLNILNESDPIFRDRLNLDLIGILGMSLGGITANKVCLTDSRIKAGVNIDGGLYGTIRDSLIITPFLFINSQRYKGYGDLFVSRSMNDCYSVTILNSDHYNYTDYALFPVRNTGMTGSIDPAVPIDIMNKLILGFFNFYLKKSNDFQPERFLEKHVVEFVSNRSARK